MGGGGKPAALPVEEVASAIAAAVDETRPDLSWRNKRALRGLFDRPESTTASKPGKPPSSATPASATSAAASASPDPHGQRLAEGEDAAAGVAAEPAQQQRSLTRAASSPDRWHPASDLAWVGEEDEGDGEEEEGEEEDNGEELATRRRWAREAGVNVTRVLEMSDLASGSLVAAGRAGAMRTRNDSLENELFPVLAQSPQHRHSHLRRRQHQGLYHTHGATSQLPSSASPSHRRRDRAGLTGEHSSVAAHGHPHRPFSPQDHRPEHRERVRTRIGTTLRAFSTPQDEPEQ
jgi:hypothetical protein